jgi:DNA polymerase-3 subunit gamma/tau
MDSGHDPRRFLTDLLERFRDLIVVRSVPDAVSSGLIEAPEDEATRMAAQAHQFGQADLVRLADVVDEGITAMKGATPTRLQLELVCARLLLPGADDTERGIQARLDRLERRLTIGQQPAPEQGASAAPAAEPRAGLEIASPAPPRQPSSSRPSSSQPAATPVQGQRLAEGQRPPAAGDAAETAQARTEATAVPPPSPSPGPTAAAPATSAPEPPLGAAEPRSGTAGHQAPASQPQPSVESSATQPGSQPGPSSGVNVTDVRRLWPEVLVRLKEIKRTPWSLISQESTVVDVVDGVLTLSFRQATLRDTFTRRDDFQQNLRQAISDVLGADLQVEAIVDPSGVGAPPSSAPADPEGAPPAAGEAHPHASSEPGPAPADTPRKRAATRSASRARPASATQASDHAQPQADEPDDGAHPDDNDLDDSGAPAQALLERTLGARVIEEIEHS